MAITREDGRRRLFGFLAQVEAELREDLGP
jgi:hypothetical protein